jgi:hypothetical protein
MTTFVYNEAKRAFLAGELDMDSDDIRVALVMTNTTADTEDDTNTISAFTTLDECDGANYARKVLGTLAIVEVPASNKATFGAADSVWTALGDGTRQVAGALIYKHITNDADSVPIAYLDGGDFPFDGGGADVTLAWASGIILELT